MDTKIVKDLINDSNNVVILSGLLMSEESGIVNYRSEKEAYNVELEYGYSPEELYSAAFYSTRIELFYKYYKEKIINVELKPNAAHYACVELEKRGKLKSIITRSIYGLHQLAGSKNVIELHGSMHDNYCPDCGKKYDVDYIRNAKKVPLCEKCKAVIRPDVRLYGEMLDNGKTTQAADAIGKADILIVAGAALNSYLANRYIKYFNGSKIILINEKEHYSDEGADIVLRGKSSIILPQIV